MYEIYLERKTEKYLKKLSYHNFKRIIQHIKSLADNSRLLGNRKITYSEGS